MCIRDSAISQLEEELGVMLFEKNGRNTELTAFGREFLACAERSLGDVYKRQHTRRRCVMEFKTNIPIYLQVIEDIKQKIIAGTLPLGSKLPSSRELAIEYQINPNTAARIYSCLLYTST